MATDAQAERLSASDSSTGDSAAHAARVEAIRQAVPQWAQLSSGFKPAASRNPSLPTLVGLFILILCFFVVLTSISLKDRHREQSVMASLERTFAGGGMSVPSEDQPADQQVKRMMGDLRAKLGSEVPLVSGVTPETSDVLVLDLPRDRVFTGAGDIAPAFPQMLAQVSQALKTGPNDFAYEIEVGLTTPTLDAKAIAAGNAVADALRTAGFANDTAMVSLAQGKTEATALTIRLRPDARLQPGGNP